MAVSIPSYSKYEFKLEDEVLVCYNSKTGRRLKGRKDRQGYVRYNLYGDDGKLRVLPRARLTLQLYGPEQPSLEQNECDHINRKRDDDKLSNLRWASRSEQQVNRGFWGKGYRWHKQNKKWRVEFKKKCVGDYKTEEEAQAKVAEIRATIDNSMKNTLD